MSTPIGSVFHTGAAAVDGVYVAAPMVRVSGAVQARLPGAAPAASLTVAVVLAPETPTAVMREPVLNGPPLTLLPTSVAVNNALADVITPAGEAVQVASLITRLVVYSTVAVVAPQPVAPFAFDSVADGCADDRLDERTAGDAATADRATKVGRGDRTRRERDRGATRGRRCHRDRTSGTTVPVRVPGVGDDDVVDLRAGVGRAVDLPARLGAGRVRELAARDPDGVACVAPPRPVRRRAESLPPWRSPRRAERTRISACAWISPRWVVLRASATVTVWCGWTARVAGRMNRMIPTGRRLPRHDLASRHDDSLRNP